ncbi:hypothetical protein CYMTET_30361, partial [Cymbomonas tetramitiformis]
EVQLESQRELLAHAEVRREEAEYELVATAQQVTALETKLRDSQEELAAMELNLMERERELEEAIPATKLHHVMEAAEAKHSAAAQEASVVKQRLELLQEREAKHLQSMAEHDEKMEAAMEAQSRLQAQVGQLTEQLATKEAQESRVEATLEASFQERLAAIQKDHSEALSGGARELKQMQSELAAAKEKYEEVRENFSSWREKARTMMEEKDAQLEKARKGGAGAERGPGNSHSSTQAFLQADKSTKEREEELVNELKVHQQRMQAKDKQLKQLKGDLAYLLEMEQKRAAEEQQQQRKEQAAAPRQLSGSEPRPSDGDELNTAPGKPEKADIDVVYLKNVVLNYLSTPSTDSKTRDGLLPVISMLLSFTPDEFHKVKNVSEKTALGKGSLSSFSTLFG